MHRAYAFLGLSVAVLGTAIAFPTQDAPKAETQFKNIKSFKGQSASEIIPSMHFMSSALKVECSFCHAADYASDEKHMKDVAREMISMQHDINEKFFGGRNQITCATCHAGHPHPVATPPMFGTEDRARRNTELKVADVYAAYGKAVGDATKARAGLRLEGTITAKGEKSKATAFYAGDKYQITAKGKAEIKSGYNGDSMWFTMPNGIQAVPKQVVEQYVNQNEIYLGPESLPKLANEFGAAGKIADKDQLVVSGTLPTKTRVSFYFDKASGLMTRVSYSYPTILGNIIQNTDFADYRKVDGVSVPMTVTVHEADGDQLMQFRSARFEAVAPVTFDPPKK